MFSCSHDLLQVQEAVKCRVVDRQEDANGDSGGSFQNGHAQLMVWIYICFLIYSLIVARRAQFMQYLLFSVLRLTLRKTWIWLADQVSSRLRMFDFVSVCMFDLTLGTAVQKLQLSHCASSQCSDCFKFLSVVGTDVRHVPPQFCTRVLQSTSQQHPPSPRSCFDKRYSTLWQHNAV